MYLIPILLATAWRPPGFRDPVQRSNFNLAVSDIASGISSFHIWAALGWQEVMQRYRRSVLGPFWLTISTAIMVGLMGPLYAKLFQQDVLTYFAYLAVNLVLWQTIFQLVQDSCTAFIASEGYIKQMRLPLSIHVLRMLWKNLIILAHNFVVVILAIALMRPPLGLHLLLFPLAVFLFAANALWVGVLLGMACARFRDVTLMVTNLMTVAFFATPVLWKPQMLGRHEWAVNLNPFYHFLETLRAPLLGDPVNVVSWAAVGGITVTGYLVMLVFYSRFRARIAYWV